MKILLLSPYDAMSHQYWREGLVDALAEHTFEVVALPPRHFSWRVRGNSLTFAFDPRLAGQFDLVLATSMTDLAALRGMLPGLAQLPTVIYFHENQFAYPDDAKAAHRVDRQITSIYSALAADRVVFNSAYNQRTFLAGADALLAKMPDHVPAGVKERILAASRILPVPLRAPLSPLSLLSPLSPQRARREGPLTIVWNHRWEYDKGPEILYQVLLGLLAETQAFRFHLVGQQFRQVPEALAQCLSLLDSAGIPGQRGFVPRPDYLALLRESDVVLSTAHHEFQGLAVLEAVAAGASPLVPNRLAYPEFFGPQFCYETPAQAIARLQQAITADVTPGVPDLGHLMWPAQLAGWQDVLEFD